MLDLTRDELARVAARRRSPPRRSRRGKGMLKGSLVLGLEDTGSRMSRLGKGELLYGDLLTVDELLARVDAVTLDEASRSVARSVLGGADVAGRRRPVRRPRLLRDLSARGRSVPAECTRLSG